MYHFDAEATEHLHHKGNATLQSQVSSLSAATTQTYRTVGLPVAQRHVLRKVEPENINFVPGKKFLDFYLLGQGAGTMFQLKVVS